MKRILMVLTVALVMAAMVVAMASPALADKGVFVGGPGNGERVCDGAQLFNNPSNPQYENCGQL